MPRPDPIPPSGHPLLTRFLRILLWLALLSIVLAIVAVVLVARGYNTTDANVLIATALGVGFTSLLGSGLMALTFLSSRSGHDEEVGDVHIEDEDEND